MIEAIPHQGTTVVDMILDQAILRPHSPALSSNQNTLTYVELSRAIRKTTHALCHDGVRPMGPVGVCLRDPLEQTVFMLAIWACGATLVPIDFRDSAMVLEQNIKRFGLEWVVGDPGGKMIGPGRLAINNDWLRRRNDIDDDIPVPILRNSLAMITMTSGTTGTPKGMMIFQDRLVMRAYLCLHDKEKRVEATHLNMLPMTSSASRWRVFSVLMMGGHIIQSHPLLGTTEAIETILASDAESCSIPVIKLRQMLAVAEKNRPMFPQLKVLYTGGAPLHPDEKLAIRSNICKGFAQKYSNGLVGNIALIRGKQLEKNPDSVGKAIRMTTIEIVNENGQAVEQGKRGQIRARSPGMSSAVIDDNIDIKRGDYIRDGWGYTGDIGHLDQDGLLYIHGRNVDQIIRSGENIDPLEIEAVISPIIQIRECLVLGVRDKLLGEKLVVAVVPDGNVDFTQIQELCISRLSRSKCPEEIYYCDELPKTANGKLDRSKTRALVEKQMKKKMGR